MTDSELERELVGLGAALDAPADEFLLTRVRQAIDAPRSPTRRRLLIVIAFALLGTGVVAAPTIADWLGVGGVEVNRAPPPTVPPTSSPLDLGVRTTLRAARQDAGFDVAVPAALGPPDEVWIDRANSAPIVWLAYQPRPDLPEAAATGYGALVVQAKLAVSDELIATKFAEPTTSIEQVDLGAGRALWVQGTHYIGLRAPDGSVVVDRLRLADNVLLWQRGMVTLRIESALGRDESVRIARSIP